MEARARTRFFAAMMAGGAVCGDTFQVSVPSWRPPAPFPGPPPIDPAGKVSSTTSAVLLAAHMVRTPHLNDGMFSQRSNLYHNIDYFLRFSPGAVAGLADGSLRMYIVHDVAHENITSVYRGVVLLRLKRRYTVAGNDARWSAYEEALALEPASSVSSSCVFATDLPDVHLSGDVTKLCKAFPKKLFVASDVCATRSVKKHMQKQLNLTHFNASAALIKFLSTGDKRTLWNCGLVGGDWPTFESFRQKMVRRVEEHYEYLTRESIPIKAVVDMLSLNELVLQLPDSQLITGFPHGPVNAPMHGNLCREKEAEECAHAGRNHSLCIRQVLAKMMSRYYFRHKLGCGKMISCGMEIVASAARVATERPDTPVRKGGVPRS